MESRVEKDEDRHQAHLPNSLKMAGAVSQERPGFAREANEPSAQQLQRARPASDSSQPLPLITSHGHPDPKDSQCRQGGHHLVSWSADTRDRLHPISFEILFVALIPTQGHNVTISHHSPVGQSPIPPPCVQTQLTGGS